MLRLALKMLFGDTGKYLMLVAGLVFATFLMAQQTAVFCGLMSWTTATLKNVPAPIWVVEGRVEQVNETNPLLDTDVARVRSVDSVAWASPLYSGIQRVRLENGNFKIIQLIGIDATTLAGAPVKLLEGRLEDLRLPHAVIIDDLGVNRLSKEKGGKVKLGDIFEINDQEARVVGIADTMQNFSGGPYVWTTYERALQYTPPQRKMLSAVIAAPREGISEAQCVADIERETGLKGYLNKGFNWNDFTAEKPPAIQDFNTTTVAWYIRNTGIPISFGITVVVGFIVGTAISCQTFYSFVLENMKHLGALKAMGASTWTLCMMLLTQAITVGLIGYGIGMFFTAGFAKGALANEQPPFYMPEAVPPVVLGVIVVICMLSALLGIWRVARLEPAMVFRG
ncbi:ABC transporter permease [Prosthecobacter algae]|uniref:ABC transporter permease n=1 Tax=Prosthecobacter algae TaxID=1144682 RepID=A0ABP9PBL1_9BACT